jgi:Xaa-Pro aminopeptidase
VTASRLDRLREGLEGPLLVTNLLNVRYLCGFDSSNAGLLVDPDGPAKLFTDFRYIESAAAVADVEPVLTVGPVIPDVGKHLAGTVRFEADTLTFGQVQALGAHGVDLVPTSGAVEALRAVKDEGEIDAIRRAARAADRAFEALAAETWVGRSERELAWRLRQLLHAHGVDHLAFDIAVHTGLNGSKPHGPPLDTIVETRSLVTVDWGARLEGYRSDCTRTVGTGQVPPRLRELYDVCLEAQLRAVDGIEPGLTGVEADALAREVIEAAGYGDRFGHGLGHGVGLSIHEGPRLSRLSQETLVPGNVVTIEPGIYVPGLGGVRIEDLAVVRDGGVEILTGFRKGLVDVR